MDDRADMAMREVRSERGAIRLWSPAPGVFCSEGEGFVDEPEAVAYCAYGDDVRLAYPGPAIGLHDWAKITGYSTAARRIVTRWAMGVIGDFEQIHVHVASKILAMGVSIANAVLDNELRIHRDPQDFERVFAELVRLREAS